MGQRASGRKISIALKHLGEIELVGLDALSEASGREFMPHPFAHTQPSPFSGLDEYTNYAHTVVDQVHHGELNALGKWFASYCSADLRVECVVSRAGGRPPERLVAHRRGETGYLAVQQPEHDIIDVHSLSPYLLGAAVAGSLELTKPGKHPRIVIPELGGTPPRGQSTNPAVVRVEQPSTPDRSVVSKSQITAFARVQCRRLPPKQWGFDRQIKAVVWVHIDDDGDYIYSPGFRYLTPMTARGLSLRIDQLIATDVAAITAQTPER